MIHRLIPFQKKHIYEMELRERDKLVVDRCGIDFLSDESKIGVTYIRDGKIIACGGVIPLWQGVGHSWMATGVDYKEHWLVVGRYMREIDDSAFEALDLIRIQGTTEVGNEEAIRFHEWAGYKKEGILKNYGIDGVDHIMFAKVEGCQYKGC